MTNGAYHSIGCRVSCNRLVDERTGALVQDSQPGVPSHPCGLLMINHGVIMCEDCQKKLIGSRASPTSGTV